jgi:anti-sigma B factor antagonist
VEISVVPHSGVQVVRLRGDLRLGEAVDTFRNATEELIGSNETKIVVNVADVRMIDSSGLGILVRTLTTTKQRGGGLRLVQPSKLAVQTLKMTGLLDVFPIFDEESAAIASFE